MYSLCTLFTINLLTSQSIRNKTRRNKISCVSGDNIHTRWLSGFKFLHRFLLSCKSFACESKSNTEFDSHEIWLDSLKRNIMLNDPFTIIIEMLLMRKHIPILASGF